MFKWIKKRRFEKTINIAKQIEAEAKNRRQWSVSRTTPKFGTTTSCPKCGGKYYEVTHIPEDIGFIAKDYNHRSKVEDLFSNTYQMEVMKITCSCGYQWHELPLDYVQPGTAEDERGLSK